MSGALPPPNRAIAPTATLRQRFSGKWRRNLIIIGAGAAALLIVFVVSSPKPREKPKEAPQRATYSAYVPPEPPATRVAASSPMQPPAPDTRAQAPPQQPPAPTGVGGPPARPAVYSFNVGPLREDLKAKAEAAIKPQGPSAGASGITFKPTQLTGTQSFTIKNPALTLSWVTTGPIICITDTLIVTGASGETPFACHLERDVLSSLGVTLLEAGTHVVGHYKSVVGEGQNRIIAVTAQAETPNHVRVVLGGPIGDQLGAAGAPGSVDNHWWPRIGGALLVSLLDAGTNLAQSQLQSGSGNTTLNLNTGGSGGLATLSRELLAKTINIPPTITLPQHSRISLWLTQDIDFSNSYRLETRR